MNKVAETARSACRLGRWVDVKMNHGRGYDVELDGDFIGHISGEEFVELCDVAPLTCYVCGMPLHREDGRIIVSQAADLDGSETVWSTRPIRRHIECDEADGPPMSRSLNSAMSLEMEP